MKISNPSIPPVNNSTTAVSSILREVSAQLGLGQDPQAVGWGSSITALMADRASMWTDSAGQVYYGFNCYFDGTLAKYLNDGYAAYIKYLTNGSLAFYMAGYGTAGSTVSASNRLGLDYSGTLSSGKAVATNYTRTGPNYSVYTGSIGSTNVLTDSTNHSYNAPATDAKFMDLMLTFNVRSNNRIGLNGASVISTNSGGVGAINQVQAKCYEYNATTANTDVGDFSIPFRVPVYSAHYYLTCTPASGDTNTQVSLTVLGYGD